jgi:hypothetical protein
LAAFWDFEATTAYRMAVLISERKKFAHLNVPLTPAVAVKEVDWL